LILDIISNFNLLRPMHAQEDISSPRQLNAWVSERIRLAILQGDYQPGVWLRQQRIAEELGVSQMPVREALKRLAAEGMVEHIPYRGVRVAKITPEDVQDVYAHRSFLEGRAAAQAAQHIQPQELETLWGIHEQMGQRQALEHIAEYRQLNRQFHELIFQASRRPYLIRTLSQLWSAFPTMLWGNFLQTAVATLPNRDATDQQEHTAILHALTAKDSQGAERAMRQHIEAVASELLAALQTETPAEYIMPPH
jgi:DNA-binding GntR family transcriptional regulator